jgi:hemoglobin-like flavoprotein
MYNPKFVRHAKHFINMFGQAVEMLGPDTELLTDILLELGAKHVAYGVKTAYYPSMGRAIIAVIKELLGDGFTDTIEKSWYEVFGAISYDMIRAQQRGRKLFPETSRRKQCPNVSV